MRISIDNDICSGHGRCYVLSPTLFTDDDEGYGQVIGDGTITEAQRGDAERAVRGCPERAVSIIED